ncbi:MAG TPA: hypothetical protein PLN39_02470 [Candidatus Dojkabacteria bacterium]|nr:hypothetical protein [Candidatus Dojkabacteria bacterium]
MQRSWFTVQSGDGQIKEILNFVLDIFNQVLPIVSEEECIIFNDSSAEFPMLITNQKKLKLRLSVEKESYWNQVIYQMSHEIMHYALRQRRKKKSEILNWFEETICEAMSLYIMSIAMTKWCLCNLSKLDSNYYKYIGSYLNEELKKKGDKISGCVTLDCLRKMNEEAETHREWRYDIRNSTYQLFKRYPKGILEVLAYSEYIEENRLTINFNKWQRDCRYPQFIKELALIQPEVH